MSTRKLQKTETYLPRREQIKTIIIPESTEDRIIVKPNQEGLGYRMDCYDQDILGNRVIQKRFASTVFNCTKICHNVWSQKIMLEQKDPMLSAKKYLLASCSLLVVGLLCFALILLDTLTEEVVDKLGMAGFVLIISQAFITVVLIGTQIQRDDVPALDLEEECQRQLNFYLTKENRFYNCSGMNWSTGNKLYWLELQVQSNQ